MSRAERVSRLQLVNPSAIDEEALQRLLLSSHFGTSSRIKEMAAVIYHRYCTDTPEQYGQIGGRLDITAEHARRLAERAVHLLSDPAVRCVLYHTVQEGSRLWEAMERNGH